MKADTLLAWLLRFEGALLLCALPFVVIPMGSMAAVHSLLGLGEMPAGTLVEYLTRSLSLLYASWGQLSLYMATDVRRHRDLIVFLAWVRLVFAAGMLLLDVWLAMPWFWTATEGPGIAICSLVNWMLARQLK